MGIFIKKAFKAYGDKVVLDIESLYIEKGVLCSPRDKWKWQKYTS